MEWKGGFGVGNENELWEREWREKEKVTVSRVKGEI